MRLSVHLQWAVAVALWAAWRTKAAGGLLRIPPVAADRPSPITVESLVVRRVDSALRHLRTRHLCFYRSYALASVLRSLGLPVVLNIGLRRHLRVQRPWGHCWLTLDDQVVFEEPDAAAPFDQPLHDTGAGVRYWIGRPESQPFKRELMAPRIDGVTAA